MKLAAFRFVLLPLASSFLTEGNPSFVRPRVALSAMSGGKEKSKLYPFQEARKIARGHGFSNKEEFIEYSCPGAYQLPKNPEEVWSDDWNGWVSIGGGGSLRWLWTYVSGTTSRMAHMIFVVTIGGFSWYLPCIRTGS